MNVAFNHTNSKVTLAGMAKAHKLFEAEFLRAHPSATWYRSEINDISGRKWIVLDLRISAIDAEIRNIMAATPLDNRGLIISVNCTKALEEQYMPAMEAIIQSLQIIE